MNSSLSRFRIQGLYGYKNYDLRFIDNTLILVGENGTGKTTVLRLLFYVLSGQWRALSQYEFSALLLTIDGNTHKIPYALLQKSIQALDKTGLRGFPQSVRSRLMMLLEQQSEGLLFTPELETLCEQYGIPLPYMMREFDELGEVFEKNSLLAKVATAIRSSISCQILYLPTYRRIEQELRLIFKGVDDDEWKKHQRRVTLREHNRAYLELVEFGMKDVQKAIDGSLIRLKEFARENLNALTLGYLGDVVSHKYASAEVAEIQKASEKTIKSVLDRIDENILSKENKTQLSNIINTVKSGSTPDEHAKVICHYFLKLLHFEEELRQRDSQITTFCKICNEYMGRGKRFVYDSAGFSFFIEASETGSEAARNIDLRHLSSGEKQIVSLFSHLYLSGESRYFVLIDEPELSLSVPWQRRFLTDIIGGDYCEGLAAATHSPFIYDNELKRYARGLGEFEEVASP